MVLSCKYTSHPLNGSFTVINQSTTGIIVSYYLGPLAHVDGAMAWTAKRWLPLHGKLTSLS